MLTPNTRPTDNTASAYEYRRPANQPLPDDQSPSDQDGSGDSARRIRSRGHVRIPARGRPLSSDPLDELAHEAVSGICLIGEETVGGAGQHMHFAEPGRQR